MSQDKIEFAKKMMLEEGIVDSGGAIEMGIGSMPDEVIGDFYTKMVSASVLEDGLDWKAAYTLEFKNKSVGKDIKPSVNGKTVEGAFALGRGQAGEL